MFATNVEQRNKFCFDIRVHCIKKLSNHVFCKHSPLAPKPATARNVGATATVRAPPLTIAPTLPIVHQLIPFSSFSQKAKNQFG